MAEKKDSKKNNAAKKDDNKKTVEKKKQTTTKKAEVKKTTNTKSEKKSVEKKTTNKKAPTKKKENKKVDDKNKKSNTSKKQVEENVNVFKVISIVLIIIIIILSISIAIQVFGEAQNKKIVKTDNKLMDEEKQETIIENSSALKLYVIEDPDCVECQVDGFISQIKDNLIPELEPEKIDFKSERGQKLIDSLGIKIAPIFIFSENINKRDDWDKMEPVLVPVNNEELGNIYVLNPMVVQIKVLIDSPPIIDNTVVIGDENAPVTIIEFTDFECPVCAIMEGNKELVKNYQTQNPGFEAPMPKIYEEYVKTGKAKIIFYNFPIERIHQNAREAHNAAMCANEQNSFKDYADTLFAKRDEWINSENSNEVLLQYSKDLSLDETQFKNCLDNKIYDVQIHQEQQLAVPYGISGTPTFFVNNKIIAGLVDYETFKGVIESELAKE